MNWLELTALLSRPIAFHRIFAEIGGGAIPGLFLSQAFYWTNRTSDPEGWFYKTQQDWHQETSLTETEQNKARRSLKARGIIEEQRRGLPCKVYYRINKTILLSIFADSVRKDTSKPYGCQFPENRGTCYPESGKLESRKSRNLLPQIRETRIPKIAELVTPNPGNNLYTEITSEITSESTSSPYIPQGTEKREGPLDFQENPESDSGQNLAPTDEILLTGKSEEVDRKTDQSMFGDTSSATRVITNQNTTSDNSGFIGQVAPDGKKRRFNQVSGRWASYPSDEWMDNQNPKPEFKTWVRDRAVQAGKTTYSLADAASEIRNNYERAGDLWEEYQEQLRLKQSAQQQKARFSQPITHPPAPQPIARESVISPEVAERMEKLRMQAKENRKKNKWV